MRVLHVSDCFLPRLGGIENQLAELTREQQRSGHRVRIVTATPDAASATRHPVPVERITADLPWELPVHPRAGARLGRVFDASDADVVHVHLGAISPFAWSAVRAACRRGLPVVATVHSMWEPGTRWVNGLLDRMSGWADWPLVMTTVSRAAADPIHRVVGDRLDVRVVPNGVEPAGWRVGPRPHPVGLIHLVSVGRLAVRKQPVDFARLVDVVHRHVGGSIRVRATLAGEGPSRPAVERYLSRRRLAGRVHLPGRLDRAEVRRLLTSADIFVAPARRESFGLAALEARAAGLPVVAYAGSGVAEFVEPGVEGLLADDRADMSAALLRLVGDDDLRMKIAEHNRVSEPKHCTWPAVLDAFDDCYATARTLVGC